MTPWLLVGRTEELAFVAASLADPDCRGVVLGGSAGVGKSRLAAGALEAQRDAGVVTEMARATRAASSVPFGALAHLLPPAHRNDVFTDRLGVVRRLVATLVERAGDDPLVLAIDDAHLLDEGSATVVHQLAATTAARLLVTVRTGEPLPDSIGALWKEGLCERLEVQPLTRSEVAEVLERALDGPIEPTTLNRFWDLTLGNALFLRQLVTDAQDQGGLAAVRGLWRWTPGTAPGPRLTELVEAQLGRLSPSCLKVVRLLALGEPLPLAALVGITDAGSVAHLEGQAIVTVEPGQSGAEVRLSHPLFGEVVRPRIPAATTLGLVTDLASLITDGSGEEPTRIQEMRLGCWALDFGLPASPERLRKSALAALNLSQSSLAERLARAALAGGDPRAGYELGWALYQQLRHEDAAEALCSVDPQAGDEDWLSSLVQVRTWVLQFGLGRSDEARSLIYGALPMISDPRKQDYLLGFWAMALMMAGQVAEAGEVAIPLLESPDLTVRLRALSPASTSLTLAGRADEVLARTDELMGPALDMAAENELAPAWVASARITALLTAGHLDDLDRFLELIDAFGYAIDAENAALLDIVRGKLALLRGQPVTAARHLAAAAAVLDDSNLTGRQSWALPLLAEARSLTGEIDAADVQEPPGLAGRMVTTLFFHDAARARAWVFAARGELTQACEVALAVAASARAAGAFAAELMASHDALRLGARGPTVERIVELAELVSGSWAPAFAAHATALAADDGAALDVVVDRFEEIGARLLAAEAASQAAAVHARAGLRARSSMSAARSAALAATCEGARTPALSSGPQLARLTRREQEVATLAADGTPSRLIAERLFVSVRTVDNQLQQVYRKLGVHGRRGLADVLKHGK